MQAWADFARVQPLASKIITNSIRKKRISHAYLIQGLRGTGKKALAEMLTMTLLCKSRNDVEPCLTCDACQRIKSRNHPDVHWIEPDGASIKNEQIDYLRKEFAYTSVEAARKVYIINHSEKLTTNAANRLLKFLEEPKIQSTAILLTEHAQLILPTIRSRCMFIELQPLNELAFRDKLLQLELAGMDDEKARLLSAWTNNLDEAIDFHHDGKIYLMQQLVKNLFATLIDQYEERYIFIHQQWLHQLKDKLDQERGMELLLLACRDVVQAKIGNNAALVVFNDEEPLLQKAMHYFSEKQLLEMIKLTLAAKRKLTQNVHPTLVIEQLILEF